MKNKKRYKRTAAGLLCAGVLLAGAVNCYAGSGEGVEIPDKEIKTFFLDGVKMKPDYVTFKKIREQMESLVPAEASDAPERGERYIIITLKYEDETKDSFYFFSENPDEEWYVEAEDGTVYQGGEFITEYVGFSSTESSTTGENEKSPQVPGIVMATDEELKESIRERLELHEKLKKDGVVCSTEDLRADFAMTALANEATSETVQDAIEFTRWELTKGLRFYEYAKQSKILPTEDEIYARMDKEHENVKTYMDFERMDRLYKECGTTYDDYWEKTKDYEKIEMANTIVEENLHEEFKLGNDTIGEKVCKSYMEYTNCFIEEFVIPSTEQYIEETLEPLLDEAEEYYLSQIETTSQSR